MKIGKRNAKHPEKALADVADRSALRRARPVRQQWHISLFRRDRQPSEYRGSAPTREEASERLKALLARDRANEYGGGQIRLTWVR